MKIDRLVWGILFLFVGGVILLDNFDVIEFYWRNVWQFWPVALILVGVNVLLGKKESNVGGIATLAVLIITLCYLFYRGQQPPERTWFTDKFRGKFRFDDDREERRGSRERINFGEAYDGVHNNAVLNVHAGATALELVGKTDSLISGDLRKRFGNFIFENQLVDSVYNVTLRLQDKKGSFEFSNDGNDIDLLLNTRPYWDVNLHMGAGAIEMDLSEYKIKNLNFDGGAASVELKFGSLVPVTNVAVKTGVADVKIRVPEGSGCQVRAHAGLSMKDFSGFTRTSKGVYETPNFKTAKNIIYIKMDGGLSNFEVERY